MLEEVHARVGCRAGKRVAHVGGPVLQGVARVAVQESLEHGLAGDRGGEWKGAAGERFSQDDDVGDDMRFLEGEPRAGPEEAGGDLVEHEERAVLVARLAHTAERLGVMEAHSARALDERLDDDAGHVVGSRGHRLLERAVVARRRERQVNRVDPESPERAVHSVDRIRQRHRRERVPVVRTFEADDRAPRRAAVLEGLDGHLQRDLDRHRAALGEEHTRQRRG